MNYAGFRLIESDTMLIGPFEDWSRVRSHARARRRRHRHRQNIRVYYLPDPKVMVIESQRLIAGHPATLAELRASMKP